MGNIQNESRSAYTIGSLFLLGSLSLFVFALFCAVLRIDFLLSFACLTRQSPSGVPRKAVQLNDSLYSL